MRIDCFELKRFKVSQTGVDVVIGGVLLGSLPDGVVSAKIDELKGLSVEVFSPDGVCKSAVDLHRMSNVQVDGVKRTATITATVSHGEVPRRETMDAFADVLDALDERRRAGAMPESTVDDAKRKEDAIDACCTIHWDYRWESQQELPLNGEPRELD